MKSNPNIGNHVTVGHWLLATLKATLLLASAFHAAMAYPDTMRYEYDARGRLVKTFKNGVGETGYCYDKAGNRIGVAKNVLSKDPCDAIKESVVIPKPMGLTAYTHPGGGYVIRWEPVAEADQYQIELASGDRRYVNDPEQDFISTNSLDDAPEWIKACNAQNICSEKAYY